MEVCSHAINFKNQLTLFPISDVHLGSRACDEVQLDKDIATILQTPDAYCFLFGDIIDLVVRQDLKRFMASSTSMELREEIDRIVNVQKDAYIKKFKPLADAGKILGIGVGNHENKYLKDHSFDLAFEVLKEFNRDKFDPVSDCEYLGKRKIPYLGYSGFIRLALTHSARTAINNLVIYWHHGIGGGGTLPGGSINQMYHLITKFDADIYFMGHDHNKISYPKERLSITQRGEPRLITKPLRLVRTGTYLKTYMENSTTYAEEKVYNPAILGCPIINIGFDYPKVSGKQMERLKITVTD